MTLQTNALSGRSAGTSILYVDPDPDARAAFDRELAVAAPLVAVETVSTAAQARERLTDAVDWVVASGALDGGETLLSSLAEDRPDLQTALLTDEPRESTASHLDAVVDRTAESPARALAGALELGAGDDPPATDQLAALSRTTDDVVVSLDLSGFVRFVGSGIEELLGYSPEEVVERSLGELLSEAWLRDNADDLREVVAGTDQPGERRLLGRHATGREVPLELAVERVGETAFLTGRLREAPGEVTDEDPRGEDAASGDPGGALFESSGSPVARVRLDDGDVRVQSANDQFCSTFDCEEPVDELLSEVVVPVEGEALSWPLPERLQAGERSETELTCHTHDGDRTFTVRLVPIDDSSEGYVVYVDVTERRRYERRLAGIGEATRRFEAAETELEVAQTVVSIVGDVLEEPLSMMWSYDPEGERLVPMAATDAAEEIVEAVTDDAGPVLPEGSLGMETFRSGGIRVVDQYPAEPSATFPSAPLGTMLLTPVGEYGLLAVAYRSVREVDPTTRELVDVLARHAEESLQRVERSHQLQREHERFDTLVGNLPGMVYRCANAPEWPMEFVSDGCEELTGYEARALEEGEVVWGEDILHPEDREEMWERVQAALDSGESFQVTYRIVRADEEVRWMWEQGRGVYDEDGDLEALEGYIVDITDRKERERELRATKERLRKFIDGSPVGVSALAPDGTVTMWNDAMEEIFGWSEREVIGEPYPAVPESKQDQHEVLLQRAIEGDGLSQVELERETEDGDRVDVLLSTAPIRDENGVVTEIASFVSDITDRKRRERRLEALFENTPDPVVEVTSDERGVQVTNVNAAFEEAFGVQATEVVGATASDLQRRLGSGDRRDPFGALVDAPSEQLPFEREVRCDTDSGVREFLLRVVPVEGSDRLQAYAWYVDVTERKRRQRQLETLNELTQELSAGQSEAGICATGLRAVREVLGTDLSTMLLYDEEGGRLVPHSEAERASQPFDPDADEVWETYLQGQQRVYDSLDPDSAGLANDPDLRSGVLLPVGKQGVLAVGARTEAAFSGGDLDLARLLVAHLDVALERVGREQALRDHADRLEERKSQLERLDRINQVMRDIVSGLVGANDRARIEETVCTKLVGIDPFEFAWIGRRSSAEGEVAPHASAGVGGEFLEDGPRDGETPAEVAISTGEPQVHDDLRADLPIDAWRATALGRGFRSMVAVPLSFRETRYGALCVYAEEPGVFDDLEVSVLVELGQTVGYAINAVESKKALVGDTAVELEFTVSDPEIVPLWAARQRDAHFEFESIVERTDGTLEAFFYVEGATPEEVRETADSVPAVADLERVTEREGGHLYRSTLTEASFLRRLVEYGALPTGLEATSENARVTVELPRSGDVGAFVEMFVSSYEGAQLVARRELDEPVRTETGFATAYRDRLTDRQEEVLETAYHSGFFESPRDTTGAELADLLGVSQPTINRHVREGERKLFELLFDDRTG